MFKQPVNRASVAATPTKPPVLHPLFLKELIIARKCFDCNWINRPCRLNSVCWWTDSLLFAFTASKTIYGVNLSNYL